MYNTFQILKLFKNFSDINDSFKNIKRSNAENFEQMS